MLKNNGFSLDEISNLTMSQLRLYCKEIQKREQKTFISDVLSSLLGSRGTEEAVKELIEEN